MHVYSVKQIHVEVDTIVSFVIQSGQVSEGRGIFVSGHVNLLYSNKMSYHLHTGTPCQSP